MFTSLIKTLAWPYPWNIGGSDLKVRYAINHDSLMLSYNLASVNKLLQKRINVHFLNCTAFKFVKMRYDLEALQKHPYYHLGLKHFEAHEYINSPWLEEQKQLNVNITEEQKSKWKHYILSFKDELLEIIATEFLFKK